MRPQARGRPPARAPSRRLRGRTWASRGLVAPTSLVVDLRRQAREEEGDKKDDDKKGDDKGSDDKESVVLKCIVLDDKRYEDKKAA
jgi:hypothetical protein